jgi:hypothetical protein
MSDSYFRSEGVVCISFVVYISLVFVDDLLAGTLSRDI